MGLYNLVFGRNSDGPALLAMLGLTETDVGRFRDAFVAEGKIVIYTRNGGGNREHYSWGDEPVEEGPECGCTGCVMTYRIPKLKYYSHDRDDEFDCTYASVFFDFPPEYAEGLRAIDSGEPWDPDARWRALIESIQKKE